MSADHTPPSGQQSAEGRSSDDSPSSYAANFTASNFTSPNPFTIHQAYPTLADMSYDPNFSIHSLPSSATATEFDITPYTQGDLPLPNAHDSNDDRTPLASDFNAPPISPTTYPSPSDAAMLHHPHPHAFYPYPPPYMQGQMLPGPVPYPVQTTPEGQIFYLNQGDIIPPGAVMYHHGPRSDVPPPVPPHLELPSKAVAKPVDENVKDQVTKASSASAKDTPSTSSAPLTGRPKMKLTHEDKRTIVIMSTEDASLRQEDIAKIYG